MNTKKNVLIVGTGPVAIQVAIVRAKLKDYQHIDLVGRCDNSNKSMQFCNNFKEVQHIEVQVQNVKHQSLVGKFSPNRYYPNISDIYGSYDELLLAVPADAYIEIIDALPVECLMSLKSILLISPTFGSNMMVHHYLKEKGVNIEVVSWSTYFSDTRIINHQKAHIALTTGVKKQIYIASTRPDSTFVKLWIRAMKRHHVQLVQLQSPIEVEARNISLYVHPPLFMNDFSLKAVFDVMPVPVYVYKLYPEGPITMTLIHEMRLLWEEMNAICYALKVLPINLLKTMVDENYQIQEETMQRHYIDTFESLNPIQQEYLLYVRYSAILIDPFSIPDAQGKYFDFSAVLFKPVYINQNNKRCIPRMPKEDYYRIKVIQFIGKILDVQTPMIDQFIMRYTYKIKDYKKRYDNLSQDFDLDLKDVEIRSLNKALNKKK